MRPLAEHWACKPGNYDPLKATQLFKSDNKWGIPVLKPVTNIPDDMDFIAYDDWRCFSDGKRAAMGCNTVVHFYTDDYRFESVWNNPERTWPALERAAVLLSPDFSLYTDHPAAVHMWNTYRNRWIGAWWQARGAVVIPTVGWAGPDSYDFAFQGIQHGAVVSVSSVGVMKSPEATRLFKAGCDAMFERIAPSKVLFYGDNPYPEMEQRTHVTHHRPYHDRLRAIDVLKKQPKVLVLSDRPLQLPKNATEATKA